MKNVKKYLTELVAVSLLTMMYRDYLPAWVGEWSDFESFYAFGFFMIAFLAYLFIQHKDYLLNIPKSKSLLGIPLLLAGSFLYIAGIKGSMEFLVSSSLPLFLGGIILTLYGRKTFLYILLPLVLFALTLPIFPLHRITMPLQMVSADLASGLLRFLGISSFNEGSIIFVERFRLSVTPGCSGLKSLYSVFFISIIYSYFINAKIIKKLGFVLISLPLALLLNAFRIVTVGFYALYNGYNGIDKFHDDMGLVFYVIAIGLIFTISKFVEEKVEEVNEI